MQGHSELITEALRDAEKALKKNGTLTSYAKILTLDDCCVVSAEFFDDRGKDFFANCVRAMTVRHRAHTVLLVSEAWKATPNWTDRPSLDPNRTEVVLVKIESHDCYSSTEASINRDFSGRVESLGTAKVSFEASNGEGRFDGLLMPLEVQHNQDARSRAKAFLDLAYPLGGV